MAEIDGQFEHYYFNLDAAVVSARDDVLDNLNSAIKSRGLPPVDTLEYESLWGLPLQELIQQTAKCSPEDADLVTTTYREFCRKNGYDNTIVYDEMDKLLHQLRSTGADISCVSSYIPAADTLLQKLNLHDCFTSIDDTMNCRERYWSAQVSSGKHDELCVVSDRPVDIKTANSLGCFTVAVTWGAGSDWDLGIEAPSVILNTVAEGMAFFFEGQIPGGW